ncbi:MAG TPA: response regulator [Deltaproteobacteria bacterium]|nr:response regulator [Deltaproteobacteria bacterium]
MADSVTPQNSPFVLVVDDDATILFLARQYLSKTGFVVAVAENGRIALPLIEKKKPDIVLLDVQMPVMNGFDTCAKIREMPDTKHMPILMVTGLDDYESIEKAYQAGATDFFTKPINWLLLEHRIRYVLRHSRTEEALRTAREELERRVEERTEELQKTNTELQEEIRQRQQAEQSQKEAYEELKSAQSQLVQSAKLASIGELAAGVVHELNQPLMVIRGYTQTLLRHPGDSTDINKWLKLIEKNTGRMTSIINHLRIFSRQSQSKFKPVDLNQVIEDAFLMVSEQLRLHDIQTVRNLSADVPKIKGDANKLEQVILNLITNARDAIEQRRKKEVQPDTVDYEQPRGTLEIETRMPDSGADFVEVLVKDTGSGIPEDAKHNIFDPFFTTKEVGKGTGLGLSISYGIIKEHHAEIEIAETGPEGTTFRIKFPVEQP